VSTVNNNDDAGGTNLRGLGLLGSFFDWLNMLCIPGQFSQNHLIATICRLLPKFGLIWHEPGNAAKKTRPSCNIWGCQCDLHPLDPAKTFFWFGVWVPKSYAWSGGGVCIALRTKSEHAIQPGTGSLRFETKLIDIIGNALGPKGNPTREAFDNAVALVTSIAAGFSTERALYLNLKGQPPLLVNARRRNNDDKHKNHYTSDKEYFWQCIHHDGWAFPSNTDESACKAMTGHFYMKIVVDLANVIKRLDTKAEATTKSPDKKFSVGDLFAFSMDLTVMVSVELPSALNGDVVDSCSPINAYKLFLLFLQINFSIMLVGSATMTLLLGKFSGGLFRDWTIKLAALLLYFRKSNGAGALYFTYSKGEAANDMAMLEGITPNLPAAKEVATSGFKLFSLDSISDLLKAAGVKVPGSLLPTGLQVQIYGILTGCTGAFPNVRCDLNSNTIGFGFKLCLLTGGGNGHTAFLEKPLSDPKAGKSDTLVFCFADLKETEPFCLDLGFLLWLLNVFLALAQICVAIAQAIEAVFQEIGKIGAAIGDGLKKIGEGIQKGFEDLGNAAREGLDYVGRKTGIAKTFNGRAEMAEALERTFHARVIERARKRAGLTGAELAAQLQRDREIEEKEKLYLRKNGINVR